MKKYSKIRKEKNWKRGAPPPETAQHSFLKKKCCKKSCSNWGQKKSDFEHPTEEKEKEKKEREKKKTKPWTPKVALRPSGCCGVNLTGLRVHDILLDASKPLSMSPSRFSVSLTDRVTVRKLLLAQRRLVAGGDKPGIFKGIRDRERPVPTLPRTLEQRYNGPRTGWRHHLQERQGRSSSLPCRRHCPCLQPWLPGKRTCHLWGAHWSEWGFPRTRKSSGTSTSGSPASLTLVG